MQSNIIRCKIQDIPQGTLFKFMDPGFEDNYWYNKVMIRTVNHDLNSGNNFLIAVNLIDGDIWIGRLEISTEYDFEIIER